MRNIKSIELTAPKFGLSAGSTLTRLNADSPFQYVSEHVGDSFTSKHNVSVSASMIDNSFAKAIEWFEPRKSAKHVISELTNELNESKAYNAELGKRIEDLESKLEWHKLVAERIAVKRTEFENKLAELERQLEEDVIVGEPLEWADEAMTVYYNLIDLLKKLTA